MLEEESAERNRRGRSKCSEILEILFCTSSLLLLDPNVSRMLEVL